MKFGKRFFADAHAVKFRPERVQKQRADDFEDVFLRGVVRAEFAAGFGVHDALKHGAEDGGRDGRPVEVATIQKRLPHGGVEVRRGQKVGKEAAVDVAKLAEPFRQVGLFRQFRCRDVQDFKKFCEAACEVGAVFLRVFNQALKTSGRENLGILGKKTEHQPHQIDFQRVPVVAARFEGIMQAGGFFGSAHVDRDFFGTLAAGLKTRQPGEVAHVAGQVCGIEARALPAGAVV